MRNWFTRSNSSLNTTSRSTSGVTNSSTQRLRMAREISPNTGFITKKIRKLLCGRITRSFPSTSPHSFISRKPLFSRRLFSRSSTEALQKLALSNTTQYPRTMASISDPSIHSNATWFDAR